MNIVKLTVPRLPASSWLLGFDKRPVLLPRDLGSRRLCYVALTEDDQGVEHAYLLPTHEERQQMAEAALLQRTLFFCVPRKDMQELTGLKPEQFDP